MGFLLCLFYETGHGVGTFWLPISIVYSRKYADQSPLCGQMICLLFFCRRKDFGVGNLVWKLFSKAVSLAEAALKQNYRNVSECAMWASVRYPDWATPAIWAFFVPGARPYASGWFRRIADESRVTEFRWILYQDQSPEPSL